MQSSLFAQNSGLESDDWAPDFPKTATAAKVDHDDARKFVASIVGPNKGKDGVGAFWLTMSAFHKEIRRSDPTMAFAYGRAMKAMMNNSGVKAYLYGIVLEETRSLDLMRYVFDNRKSKRQDGSASDNWVLFLKRWIKAKKRWELPFSFESEALLTKIRSELEPRDLSALEIAREIDLIDHPAQAYELFLSCLATEGNSQNKRYAFYTNYLKRLPDDVASTIDRWIGHYRFGPNFNVLQSLIDFDFWPETITDGNVLVDRGQPNFDIDYYKPKPRAYDRHNRAGSRRLSTVRDSWVNVMTEGQPSGVDIRWDADQVGCTWRAFAYKAFGEESYREADILSPFKEDPDALRQAFVAQAKSSPKLFMEPR